MYCRPALKGDPNSGDTDFSLWAYMYSSPNGSHNNVLNITLVFRPAANAGLAHSAHRLVQPGAQIYPKQRKTPKSGKTLLLCKIGNREVRNMFHPHGAVPNHVDLEPQAVVRVTAGRHAATALLRLLRCRLFLYRQKHSVDLVLEQYSPGQRQAMSRRSQEHRWWV